MKIDINIIAIEAVLTSAFLISHKSFISQKLVVIISPEYSIPIKDGLFVDFTDIKRLMESFRPRVEAARRFL